MLLAIDVGNTNAVFAVHDGQKVVGEWRCRTERQRTADEYFVWLRQLMDFGRSTGEIDSVVVSSVVPQVLFNLRVLADRYFQHPRQGGRPARRAAAGRAAGRSRRRRSAPTGWSTPSARTTATAAISSSSTSAPPPPSTWSTATAPMSAA